MLYIYIYIYIITPLAGDSHYISFFKPNYSWPVIHLVFSDQGHYTFLYRHAKHNREGGRKEQTNKHGLGSAPSAKKGECVTLCVLWANVSVYSNEILTCWHILVLILSSLCLLLLNVAFSGQLPQVDWSLLPFFVNCSFCLLWDLPSLLHFRPRRRSCPQAHFVGFAPKQT